MIAASDVIIGHKFQISELQRDIEADNVAHAYLFSGPAHLGKMTVARWFGHKLLCEGLSEEACEKASKDIKRLTHPDLLSLDQLWIEGVCDDWDVIAKSSNIPQEHRAKKPPAKTDIISIDDIRGLQERLVETGTGKYRVCIIRSMERMQDAAANAFLKILEEPPKGLVFLLTTQRASSLLPTIVSRTRRLRFSRLSKKDLLPALLQASEDDQQFISHLAQGCSGIALSLAKDPDLLREHRQVQGQARSFWKSSSLRERLQTLSPLHTRGQEADQFLLHLSLALREMSPDKKEACCSELTKLLRGYQSNTHRQLLAQRFALAIGS